jgi:hypothetical protein
MVVGNKKFGVVSHLLPRSATMVGTERGNFENFVSLNRRKWHFQSLLYLFSNLINSFIMICESMLSVSQDGLLREMLLSKYRLQIFDYIYIYTL